jgi:putative transcriptional regulator
MNSRINHHPSTEQLKLFNEGLLSTGLSVAVSAHMDFCVECHETSNHMKSELADDWIKTIDAKKSMDADQFSHLIDEITSQDQSVPVDQIDGLLDEKIELHMHERSVKLPRVLSKAAGKGVVWKTLPGGINTANLGMDRETQCDFMYMKPGSQAPRHKHHGLEVTLVLDGTFCDELGEYYPGDFVLRRGSETHTPQSEEGCLCYSVLDSPLIFTSGFSRLLNPFQKYVFNKKAHQRV